MTFQGEPVDWLTPRQAFKRTLVKSLETIVTSKSEPERGLKLEMLGYKWSALHEAIWIENLSGVNGEEEESWTLRKQLYKIWTGKGSKYAASAFFHHHFLKTVLKKNTCNSVWSHQFYEDMLDVMSVLYHRYNFYKTHLYEIPSWLVLRLEGVSPSMIFTYLADHIG